MSIYLHNNGYITVASSIYFMQLMS